MIYSQNDVFQRIKATLPLRWFNEDTPILDLVLTSMSAGWVALFSLLDYVSQQCRIRTASDGWLDLIALDYFGDRTKRRLHEVDGSFRRQIFLDLLRERCTRVALYDTLEVLTGRPPTIFEPSNPGDTGCFCGPGVTMSGGSAYNCSGGWGSLDLPFQVFVRAYRPEMPGIALINGWNGNIGGFGGGFSSYVSSGGASSGASDLEICKSISSVVPAGTVVWMSIES